MTTVYVEAEVDLDRIPDQELIDHLKKKKTGSFLDDQDYHNGRMFSDVILDAHLHCKKTGRLDLATRLDDLRNWLLSIKE